MNGTIFTVIRKNLKHNIVYNIIISNITCDDSKIESYKNKVIIIVGNKNLSLTVYS